MATEAPVHAAERPRVVIIGAGFGGFFAALALEKAGRRGERTADVTLLAKTNSFLYTPFLPLAAGGSLEPRHVVVPIRELLPHTHLLVGRVVGHDGTARTVELAADGGVTKTIPYDHLIVAPGSVSRTLPIPGLESAVGFKTLAEAIHLRNRVLRQLEIANVLEDPEERAAALTFVFVGGGYAGLESLAELEDLVRDAKPLYRSLTGDRARFVLVEAQEAVIPEVGGRLSAYAMRQLAQRDIEMRLGTTVVDASGGAVTLRNGERIRCHTLVWTAGVRPHPTIDLLGLPTDDRGRIAVDATMAVDGHPGIWALGDAAAVPDPARPGLASPPTSQHAIRQARVVASNVLAAIAGRPPRPFRYRTRGVFVDLGHLKAVASVFGLQFSGFPAWFLTRSYHLLQIPGARRKARVAADWTVGLIFKRDLVELSNLGQREPLISEERPPAT